MAVTTLLVAGAVVGGIKAVSGAKDKKKAKKEKAKADVLPSVAMSSLPAL